MAPKACFDRFIPLVFNFATVTRETALKLAARAAWRRSARHKGAHRG
jgi:hypothetical protein